MKWLWDNLWLKIAAFIMGLLIWVHVATEKTYNYELKLPISEISLKDNLSLSKAPLDSLEVAVSATGKQLLRQAWRNQGLRINASGYQAGRYSMSLSTSNTFLVHQEAIISLDEVVFPRSIQLEIDVEGSVELAVATDLELSPDDGFAVDPNIIIVPPKVKLVGPRSQLGRITTILTEKKKLDGLRNDVTMTLRLLLPEGYGYRLQPDSVQVTIPVIPVKTRVYSDLLVAVINVPPSTIITLEPNEIEAQITGPPIEIDRLPAGAVTVSIDYRDIDTSGYAPLRIDCPPGFRLKKTSADSVLIQVVSSADTRD